MKDIKNKKIKIIILTIVLLFIAVPTVMINTGALQQISAFLFGSQDNLFEYAIIDNRDENKISVLATISAENELEYVEKDDGTVINANGSKTLSLDFIMSKDEQKEVKIKERGKGLVTKTIILNDEIIKNTALDLITEFEIDGYKTLSISRNEKFPSQYNKITYKIGKDGAWYNYNGSFSIVDYDIYENKLDNLDNTLTITAKLTNPETSCEVSISKDYNMISPGYENEPITADSLLKAAENITDTGTYNITVNDQMYTTRVYCFNEDMDITANTSFGTEKDVSTGGDSKNTIIVKVNGNLNIDNSTLTAYASKNGYGGPKGMMIYCTGTITNNGTISMTARGARAPGQDVYLWKNADESFEYVPAVGAAGGSSVYAFDRTTIGNSGSSGANRQTGGGASGSAVSPYNRCGTYSGAGAAGTSYSGGSGGGGINSSNSYGSWMPSIYATSAEGNGGTGGNSGSGTNARGIGGVGNPGGATASKGNNGTGGLLIIYGNNIINENEILSQGTNNYGSSAAGGGSGGGSINIFFNNTYTDTGTINVAGGSGGGTGGTGTITICKIVNGTCRDKDYVEPEQYKTTYSIGDVVTLGGEEFYVIEDSNANTSTVKLLAAQNVITTEGDANRYKQDASANKLRFADNSNVYANSKIKPHVDAYKLAVEGRMGAGKTIEEARLMTKEEVVALGGNIENKSTSGCTGTTAFVNATNYWLSSRYENSTYLVWFVRGSDSFLDGSYVNRDNYGLRPVIVVLKSNI